MYGKTKERERQMSTDLDIDGIRYVDYNNNISSIRKGI